ncbi:Imm26 family immunity protein [Bacillus sp. MUM 116]|uniref:Imm26 family immunity protein n=1 Tax=Bacillus sp. MUM 116 TaxID=1678002 RepID=UPI000AC25C09|nr:Imm26 family immunity protein [Bacillus sp. MUM 116]
MEYPFKPKSNRFLIPGQFWAIPLNSGKFACGRVIQIMPKGELGSTKCFLAGLMNWVGDKPPTSEDLAVCSTIKQGDVHIVTIHETGLDGMIQGFRPLEIDGIEPNIFSDFDNDYFLTRGYEFYRRTNEEEWKNYEHRTSWGSHFIKELAEHYFGVK